MSLPYFGKIQSQFRSRDCGGDYCKKAAYNNNNAKTLLLGEFGTTVVELPINVETRENIVSS